MTTQASAKAAPKAAAKPSGTDVDDLVLRIAAAIAAANLHPEPATFAEEVLKSFNKDESGE